MAYYLVQAKPTTEFWSHALTSPEEINGQWVSIVVERLGGKIHGVWVSFGEYDVTLICEMPDAVTAAALSMAYSALGTIVSVKTTALLTPEEAMMALRKASGNAKGS